jgi:hypothetical protein
VDEREVEEAAEGRRAFIARRFVRLMRWLREQERDLNEVKRGFRPL